MPINYHAERGFPVSVSIESGCDVSRITKKKHSLHLRMLERPDKATGHDLLSKHLHRFGIMPTTVCILQELTSCSVEGTDGRLGNTKFICVRSM